MFVQLVMAAITTEPCFSCCDLPSRVIVAVALRFGPAAAPVLGLALDSSSGSAVGERFLHVVQAHAILRPAGPGQARLDGAQVERQRVGIDRFRRRGGVEQALFLGVRLDELHQRLGPAGEPQETQRLGIDGEDAARGPVLGGHVGDGGPVGQRQVSQAGAIELDEFAHHAFLAQHLGHGQHQVRRGGPLGQSAFQPEADHLGDEHRHGLAQHGRLRFDAADAPAQHAQPVDHGRVRIGAHQGIGVGQGVRFRRVISEDHAGQVFQIDLVARCRSPAERR